MYEQTIEVLRAELVRVSYERNEAEAEVERLRGLLRDAYDFIPTHNEIDFHNPYTRERDSCSVCQLRKRVHEALGE